VSGMASSSGMASLSAASEMMIPTLKQSRSAPAAAPSSGTLGGFDGQYNRSLSSLKKQSKRPHQKHGGPSLGQHITSEQQSTGLSLASLTKSFVKSGSKSGTKSSSVRPSAKTPKGFKIEGGAGGSTGAGTVGGAAASTSKPSTKRPSKRPMKRPKMRGAADVLPTAVPPPPAGEGGAKTPTAAHFAVAAAAAAAASPGVHVPLSLGGSGGGGIKSAPLKGPLKSCLKSSVKDSGGASGASSVRKNKGFTAGMLGMSVDGKKRVRFQCTEHDGHWRMRKCGGGRTLGRITMMMLPNQPYHIDGVLNDQSR
jgi:hypothetical protein